MQAPCVCCLGSAAVVFSPSYQKKMCCLVNNTCMGAPVTYRAQKGKSKQPKVFPCEFTVSALPEVILQGSGRFRSAARTPHGVPRPSLGICTKVSNNCLSSRFWNSRSPSMQCHGRETAMYFLRGRQHQSTYRHHLRGVASRFGQDLISG